MRKLICGLVAACLSTTPAAAFDPPFVWVGQMVLLKLDNCGGGGSDTVAIVYRPKLQAGEDNSTLSYLFGFASGTVRKRAATLQFNGSGSYVGSFVTGRASTRTQQRQVRSDRQAGGSDARHRLRHLHRLVHELRRAGRLHGRGARRRVAPFQVTCDGSH